MHCRKVLLCLTVLACSLLARNALAQYYAHGPVPCAVTYVEKTVLVPQMMTERRTVKVTQYRQEQREHKYTAYRCVPETKQVTRQYTVLVPETREKDHTYTVMVPVSRDVQQKYTVHIPEWKDESRQYNVVVPIWKDVEKSYTVMVPHTEKRTGTRKVCKIIPVNEKRTIRVDRGHWESQLVQVAYTPCGWLSCCCAPCVATVCKNFWVPKVVEQEIDVTVYQQQIEDQPYEYHVVVCKPETRTATVKQCSYETQTRTANVKVCNYRTEERTRTVRYCDYKPETKTKKVRYVVCVPQKRTETVNVTSYKTVAEVKTGTHTVCVPYQVNKEIDVQVCRLVAKKITVPVYCGPGYPYHK